MVEGAVVAVTRAPAGAGGRAAEVLLLYQVMMVFERHVEVMEASDLRHLWLWLHLLSLMLDAAAAVTA